MRTTKSEMIDMGKRLAEMMNKRNKHNEYEFGFSYGWGLMKYYKYGGQDYVICARGHKESDLMKITAAILALYEI